VLVRNLPTTVEQVDRVREHLSIMIEGLDTRIQAMQSQTLLDQRREVLHRVLTAAREHLGRLDETSKQQRARSAEIVTDMGKELERSLLKLDLSAREEAALKKIIDSAAEQTAAVYDEGMKIGEKLQEIMDELSSVLDE
jgi:hypothetical protein